MNHLFSLNRAVLDRDQAVASLQQALAALGEPVAAAGGDAIEQLECGDLLLSDDAAIVGGARVASTVARWAQDAEDEGSPIALKVGNSWLFVTSRLLNRIERKSGRPARREAETRLRKMLETRASAQKSNRNACWRAASAPEACES
jgi:hypothetical protein